MRKTLEVSLLLTAVDMASGVFNKVMSKQKSAMNQYNSMGSSLAAGAAGGATIAALKKMSDEYGNQQEAALELKARLLDKSGNLDQDSYERMQKYAQKISDTYTGTTEDYLRMMRVMMENRLKPQDILGGVGETAAKLSTYLGVAPDQTALLAARLQADMKVDTKDMPRMMDMIARMKGIGVGRTGDETVQNLTEFYGKAGLGAKLLGVTGSDEAEQLGRLGSIYMSQGLTGQTVGTNIRRMLDSLRNGDHYSQMQQTAAQYGQHLDFFDDSGKFKGMKNFVDEVERLENLNPQVISAIFKPMGGKQGLSTDFVEYLAKEGSGDMAKSMRMYEEQADLNKKTEVMLTGQNKQYAIMKTNIANLTASIGKSFSPEVTKLSSHIGEMVSKLNAFVQQHQELTKLTAGFAAMAAAVGLLKGAITGIAMVSPGAAAALGGLINSTAASTLAGMAASAMILETFVKSGGNRAEQQIKKNPTGDRERLMEGYDKIIEDSQTGWVKRNLARMVKAGIGWNIALFGDDKPNPNAHPNDTSKEGILADIAANKAARWKSVTNSSSGWEQLMYGVSHGGNLSGLNSNERNAPLVTYSPTITIQGDATPGALASFKEQLQIHKQDIGRIVQDTIINGQRKSYSYDGGYVF